MTFPTVSGLQGPVGLVGVGLIGGSIGLDLRARGMEVRALVHRRASAARVIERGLADQVSSDPELLSECRLVVLALPLDRLLDPPARLLNALPGDAVITDVGSVKAPVLECWQPLHPRFVAGHPMAGTSRSGVEAGVAGLFVDRPWVATPAPSTDPEALEQVRRLAQSLGAHWLCCSAEEHDRAVALISHLPVLVSAALLLAVGRGAEAARLEGAPELPQLVRALASSGFADTSRVGGGNPELGHLMARCNQQALLEALVHYREALELLEQTVRTGQWAALRSELETSEQLRREFV